MAGACFLDTSAVTKRYVVEVGSAWVTALTAASSVNECWLAAITRVELLVALYLRSRTGSLNRTQAQQADQLFRQELSRLYRLLPISDAVLNRAMSLVGAHPLRAYDAVQRAAALELQAQRVAFGGLPPLTFVSADQNLNRAAAAEGLAVDDPNTHP
jgi:predicted nucleic acid-binding protein